jgi:hypothetical protein
LARDFESRTNGIMITAIVFSGLTSLALAGNYLYFGQAGTASGSLDRSSLPGPGSCQHPGSRRARSVTG